jgi:tetratricopeptide (TPR) repeat protein
MRARVAPPADSETPWRTQIILSNRAAAYLKMEQWEVAVADCSASLALVWNVKAAFRRCQALTMLGALEEALADCDAVLAREPNNAQAREQAARCRSLLRAREASAPGGAAALDDDGML